MKCPKCGGDGKYLKMEQGNSCYEVGLSFCDVCHGSGKVEVTNEEWLNTLNTEQLATFLAIVQYDGTDLTLKKNHVKKWVEWLKQPHTPKE